MILAACPREVSDYIALVPPVGQSVLVEPGATHDVQVESLYPVLYGVPHVRDSLERGAPTPLCPGSCCRAT